MSQRYGVKVKKIRGEQEHLSYLSTYLFWKVQIAPGNKILEKEVKLAREKPWLACRQMLVLGLREKISRHSITETTE